jgi:threonine/homoserine/homoserine lactone efflux protein
MIALLTAGVGFGLWAGFSPGPLMTVVLTHTLQHGFKEGSKVALAPLITDVPILIISVLLLTRITNITPVLGMISIIGGFFLLHMAYKSFCTSGPAIGGETIGPQSFSRGIIANALSPYPYLFWFTVGTPIMAKGWGGNPCGVILFVAGFLSCTVGGKILLAALAGTSGNWLRGKPYQYLVRFFAVLLAVFGCVLLKDGLSLWGVLH